MFSTDPETSADCRAQARARRQGRPQGHRVYMTCIRSASKCDQVYQLSKRNHKQAPLLAAVRLVVIGPPAGLKDITLR